VEWCKFKKNVIDKSYSQFLQMPSISITCPSLIENSLEMGNESLADTWQDSSTVLQLVH